LAYLLTASVAAFIVIKKSAFTKLYWNPTFLLMILKQSFPFALLFLMMSFYNRIDSVMIERLLPRGQGTAQVDIYAKAYRLLDSVNMIAYLFSVLLIPIFSKLIKEKTPVVGMVKLSFTIIFTISMIVATCTSFFGRQIMDMLYVGQIHESAVVFVYLIIGFVPISATYIFGTLLTANGSLRALNVMAVCGMVINIGLNFILIPRFLAVGSAWSSLATQFTTALIQIAIAQYIFKFKINWKYLTSLLFFAIGVVLVCYFASHSALDWRMAFVMAGITSLVWAFVLKLLDINSFFKLMKNEQQV